MNESLQSYWHVARRHRVVLCIPIVIALAISTWYVATTPSTYEATTSIWYDNPVPEASAVVQTDPTLRTPAAQKQLLLNEHLSTRSFRIKVASRGPLSDYLATHKMAASGPIELLQKLRGTKTVEDRAVDALGPANIHVVVIGPQVLAISVLGPTPEVALGTLQALIDEFAVEDSAIRESRAEGAVKFFQDRVDSASKALAVTQDAVSKYVIANPIRPENDPQLVGLTQTASTLATQLADANNSLNQAIIEQKHLTTTTPERVLDEPGLRPGTVSGRKPMVPGMGAGFFAGLVVSGLGLWLQTARASRNRLTPARSFNNSAPSGNGVSSDGHDSDVPHTPATSLAAVADAPAVDAEPELDFDTPVPAPPADHDEPYVDAPPHLGAQDPAPRRREEARGRKARRRKANRTTEATNDVATNPPAKVTARSNGEESSSTHRELVPTMVMPKPGMARAEAIARPEIAVMTNGKPKIRRPSASPAR